MRRHEHISVSTSIRPHSRRIRRDARHAADGWAGAAVVGCRRRDRRLVLDDLVRSKFLHVADDGSYARGTDDGPSRLRTAKAEPWHAGPPWSHPAAPVNHSRRTTRPCGFAYRGPLERWLLAGYRAERSHERHGRYAPFAWSRNCVSPSECLHCRERCVRDFLATGPILGPRVDPKTLQTPDGRKQRPPLWRSGQFAPVEWHGDGRPVRARGE